MASSSRQDRKCEYYILQHENEVLLETYASKTILNISRPERFRFLKGTLLYLSPSKPAYSGGSKKILVCSLDDENLEFDCPLADISPLQPIEKDLLIAVTSRAERYKLYACHNEFLAFGLICNSDDWVHVEVKIDGNLTDVAGVIRYKGELPTERGIHFGVELEEYRGAGTTDGTFRNHQFFACQQDCGVFVPITRIKKRYQDYNRNKRHYRRTPDILELDSALSPSDIYVHQRVLVFTEEGKKEGHVLYCGIPPGSNKEYVGIEFDHPVKSSDRTDGTYEGWFLFRPRDFERTVLCPKASVLPLASLDQPGTLGQHSIEMMETSVNPFDFHVGSQVSIDTEQDGIKYGLVIWIGEPECFTEQHVGIELDSPCSRHTDCNDGTYKGKRLFHPKHVERTVLVPAKSVCTNQRSLSSETVRDSLGADDTAFAPMVDFGKIQDPIPRQRHHSESSMEYVAADIERPVWTDVSDAIVPTSPGKTHSAPVSEKYSVYGRAIDPGEVQVKAHVKSSSTGYVPTSAKYGQTSTIGATSRGTTRPKDTTSKTSALAMDKRENNSWTTKKFPKFHTEGRSRKNKTEDRPSGDIANTKGHRTKGQDHGRVVSKFTLLDDVLNNVAIRVHGNWKTLAENLGIMNKEITQIVDHNTVSKDCAMDMLRRWREQMSSSRDKLGPLIKACHKSDLHPLANEIEQGLDEQRLHHIAGQVHETVWNVLGDNLGLDRDHLSRLQMEDPHPSQRVYNMLLDWRLTLTFDSDKPLLLAKALGTIGMDELALEICRGLTGEVLEDLAGSVKDFWKRLGKELHFTTRELQDLHKGDDINTAYRVILRWKRHQEPEGDLLGALSAALKKCERESLANKVVIGMDDTLLEVVANMVEDKQHSIANALGIPLQEQFGHNDSRHSSKPNTLRLLQWWRANRAMNKAEGQRKLFDVLMKYGYNDAADMVFPVSLRPEGLPERNPRMPRVPPPRDSVYGRAKDPGEERVKARVKSSSTGYMPTSAKYKQTSTIGGTSRGTTRPKDTTSKTSALATGKRENNSWTTGTKKFPKSHTKSRSRKSETEDRPSADIASTDRKTPKVKGHRTIGQDHGRVVSKYFGNQESPIIEGYVRPQRFQQSFVGENKGIQGDQNSCYLDVTLYSMFSFNVTFDPLLIRPKDVRDVDDFQEIQTILREKIVNPLRQNGFVQADRVRDLRLHLDKLGLLPGITNEEKDPEELLHLLFRDVLKAQPLIKTRHGDKKEIDNQYLYQIFMEKNDSLQLPKVEQVLHQSFLDNELKLVEIPECLIVQMPRLGKDYKMYSRILPSLTIDITDLLESYPRQCTICGELAKVECRDCRTDEEISKDFIKSYCQDCCDMTHSSLPTHRTKQLILNPDVQKGFELISRTKKQELPFQRQRMELYAMLCIQTSHYVAFVKTEPMNWVYFDSMAYRDTSTVPGFYIPKVTHLKNLEGSYPLRTNDQPDDKKLPEHFRRLLGDAYICFYRKIGVKQMGEYRVAVDRQENGP